MYYLYIDESGDEGDYVKNGQIVRGSSRFFTMGGIIINENNRGIFTKKIESIRNQYFRNVKPIEKFKLHYCDLIANKFPYSKITRLERYDLANAVFDAVKNIDCHLISVTLDLYNHCRKYSSPLNPRGYTMYLLLERFQLFIEEKNDNGIAIYENYNSHLRKKVELIHKWIVEYPDFPSNVRFNNIEKTVRNGDPIVEPMLQYADFLVWFLGRNARLKIN